MFEREARGNIDVFDGVFIGGLQEGIKHACMIEFFVNHFVDDFGQRDVAFVSRAVFDEHISDVSLTFAGKRPRQIFVSFAVFQIFHKYLRKSIRKFTKIYGLAFKVSKDVLY